jgi:hypothetical protein
MKNEIHDLIYADECYAIMGACFVVYRDKGCGFVKPVYQECLRWTPKFGHLGFLENLPSREVEKLQPVNRLGSGAFKTRQPDSFCWPWPYICTPRPPYRFHYAINFSTSLPCTSVSRKSRPWKR